MRFLVHISDAKWQSRWLSLWYLALVGAVAAVLALLVCTVYALSGTPIYQINTSLFSISFGLVVALILIVSLIEFLTTIGDGGMRVMAHLKGRPVYKSEAALDIKLNHVVDEVVIAAGMGFPRPVVFVFDDETCINATTAGSLSTHFALGVTSGALRLLDREQLQGLVAHEIGHMLEEDTVVNQRLTAMSTGLRSLQTLARGCAESGDFRVLLLAAVIWLISWIGALAARILQSAVSRKREFLADAHAVRLTRNPKGLIGVLQKIAAQNRIEPIDAAFTNRHALAIGHSFFDSVYAHRDSEGAWFDTHPPLKKRIARLQQM